MMADAEQLFGSDSESEKDKQSGKGSGSDSESGSGSGSGSSSSSGSAPGSPAAPASPPAPGSPGGSAPASPKASPPGSPSGSSSSGSSSASGSSPARSGSGSPGKASPARSDGDRAKSRSRSRTPENVDNSQTSGSPRRSPVDDAGSDDEDNIGRRRQRIASDSGSDPDAVRATAEDIFGEADDISDEEGGDRGDREGGDEGEEKEEEVPETRIEVEIPRVVADLGNTLSFAKLPNFLSVETRPFDPATYEDEIDDDEVMDEEGRARLKLKVENTIRWRYLKDLNTGEPLLDEFGDKRKETNAKMIKWSDGSMSLHLGTEIFDVFSMPMQDHNHLYIRQGTGLQGQAMFRNKLSFRPHSTDSFTHKKMTMSLADRSTKSQKIKVLPIAGVNPELSKHENIKKEEERLRASIRRENQQRRTRERAHARQSMSAAYLEGEDEGAVSIAAIKNKYKKSRGEARNNSADYSDSAEEDYETDGEDDLRRNRLQKAKRLAESDEEEGSASDDNTPSKKAKIVSDSE